MTPVLEESIKDGEETGSCVFEIQRSIQCSLRVSSSKDMEYFRENSG